MENDCSGSVHIRRRQITSLQLITIVISGKWTCSLTQQVIDRMKAHFARYRIVVTDNGPQFRSQEYETFAAMWEFTHTSSLPYHSQSNVNAKKESAVKIPKKSKLKLISKVYS